MPCMTLQIFRGLILTGAMANPFHLSATIHPALGDVAAQLWRTLLAESIASHIDATRAGARVNADDRDRVAKSIHLLGGLWRQRMNEVTAATMNDRERNPGTDLGMSIKIFAHPDRSDALLAVVRAEECAYYEALLAMDDVADFSYWRTEEAPDGVTDAAWEARNEVWGRALHKGTSSVLGWTWTLLNSPVEFALPSCQAAREPERILAALPSNEARAKRLAGKMARVSPTVDPRNNFSGWIKEHEAQVATLLPAARKLITAITVEDLTGAPAVGPTS